MSNVEVKRALREPQEGVEWEPRPRDGSLSFLPWIFDIRCSILDILLVRFFATFHATRTVPVSSAASAPLREILLPPVNGYPCCFVAHSPPCGPLMVSRDSRLANRKRETTVDRSGGSTYTSRMRPRSTGRTSTRLLGSEAEPQRRSETLTVTALMSSTAYRTKFSGSYSPGVAKAFKGAPMRAGSGATAGSMSSSQNLATAKYEAFVSGWNV